MSIDAASASGARPARRDQTFFALSLLSVAIAVLGFGPTYWLGLSRGTFDAPPMVHRCWGARLRGMRRWWGC